MRMSLCTCILNWVESLLVPTAKAGGRALLSVGIGHLVRAQANWRFDGWRVPYRWRRALEQRLISDLLVDLEVVFSSSKVLLDVYLCDFTCGRRRSLALMITSKVMTAWCATLWASLRCCSSGEDWTAWSGQAVDLLVILVEAIGWMVTQRCHLPVGRPRLLFFSLRYCVLLLHVSHIGSLGLRLASG